MTAPQNVSAFTRGTSERDVDAFNQWMRSQPFWQQIRGNGSGGLSDTQRSQIESALRQQGYALPGSFHIDEGGNLNQKSRAKKIALGVGLGAGAAIGAPFLLPALGIGGAPAAMTASQMAGAGLIGPGIEGAVTGGGLSLGSMLAGALPSAISATTGLIGSHMANSGASRAADLQSAAANRAADLQSQANAEQLAFLKSQESARQREWQSTQDTNMGLFREREARLQPYRGFGQGSLGQLMRPIPRGNTLGAMVGAA